MKRLVVMRRGFFNIVRKNIWYIKLVLNAIMSETDTQLQLKFSKVCHIIDFYEEQVTNHRTKEPSEVLYKIDEKCLEGDLSD